GRTVWIFLWSLGQEPFHRVLPNVVLESLIFERIPYAPVNKAGLPDHPLKFETLIQPKSESAFNALHGPFQGDSCRGDDDMEMIRHHNKLVKEIFLLRSVIQQHFNEQAGNLTHLKEHPALENVGGDKVGGFAGQTAVRNSQRAPQWLKPEKL